MKVTKKLASSDLTKTSGASPPEMARLCYSEEVSGSLKIETKEFFNTEEASQFLGISAKTLYNLCSCGQIPYLKFGRRNRYRKDDLKALLLAHPRGDRK
jgi:excisionase family DNA binding protein